MFTLVERDLRVRYKQAFLGGIWAVIQPLMLMVVFSVVFGKIAKVGSEGLPYPVFAYSAIVPFTYFSSVLTSGMGSIVSNFSIVKKMYVPREVFPLYNVFSAGFDFAISSVILLIMIFAYGIGASVTWVAVPLLLLVLVMIAAGLGMLAGAFTAYWRDSRYAVPLLIQLVMYGSPIAYPLGRALKALGPGIARVYLYVNPLAPIMDGFRRVLLHHQWPMWKPFGVSAAVGTVLIVVAYRTFKRLDPTFSDVV
jgi:ABC-type polysaccharide/polyol phosphate export permease